MKKTVKAGITNMLLTMSLATASAVTPIPGNGIAKSPLLKNAAVTPVLNSTPADSSINHIDTRYQAALVRAKQQADILKAELKSNNYNADYCFLVDMSLPSGKNRFFVYNLKTDQIEISSLVSHGLGSNNKETDEATRFSNDPSSLQTSLGRYRVGSSYVGKFGLAFKLFGLDKTNDRAFDRAIVLHAHNSIPTTETYPIPISVSLGCPTVSPSFLEILNGYIKGSKKPIMMLIYS